MDSKNSLAIRSNKVTIVVDFVWKRHAAGEGVRSGGDP